MTRLVIDSILCQQDLIICFGHILFRFIIRLTIFIVDLLTILFVDMLTRLQDFLNSCCQFIKP